MATLPNKGIALYFDKTGILREIFTLGTMRTGDTECYLYIYQEEVDDSLIAGVISTFRKPDGSYLSDISEYSLLTATLPYSDRRDLRYFAFYKEYEFIRIPVPSTAGASVLDDDGAVACSVRLVTSSQSYTLGMITFSVEEGVTVEDTEITRSQYQYLLDYVSKGTGAIDDVKVNGVSVVANKIAAITVPTNVSELINDSGYVTEGAIPTKTSQLTNDSDYVTATQLAEKQDALGVNPSSTTANLTSLTINGTSYKIAGGGGGGGGNVDDVIVNGESVVSDKIARFSVPTATSDLTNDSDFITSDYHDASKADTDGSYDEMSVGYATSAGTATSATNAAKASKATNDGDGNNIANTYVKFAGEQTITGKKTFTAGAVIGITKDSTRYDYLYTASGASATESGYILKVGNANMVLNLLSYNNDIQVGSNHYVALQDGSYANMSVGKATNDGDGNKITDTYFKKAGGTITGAITVQGNIECTGSVTASSDRNLKENIKPVGSVDLSSLSAYRYNFILDEGKTPHVGLIAQDLMLVCPEAVKVSELSEPDALGLKEHLSVDYNAVVALLINKVNELEKRIKELENV